MTTEQDKKDIKEKAKIANLAVSLATVPASEGSLSEDLKADGKRKEIINKELPTYLALEENNRSKISSQLQSPVNEENRTIDLDKTCIGPFSFGSFNKGEPGNRNYESNFDSPKNDLIFDNIKVHTKEDLNNCAYIAYRDPLGWDDAIHFGKFDVSDEMKNFLNKIAPNSLEAEIVANKNPLAEIVVYHHERTHFLHQKRRQVGLLSPHFTGEMHVDAGYVTEKTAFVVQNLTLANLYRECKEQGIKTLSYGDKQKPLDEFLDMTPGLRETVTKYGFDPKSPESVSRVVKVASDYWDKDYCLPYQEQDFSATATGVQKGNILEAIMVAKDHEKVLKDMTKNLDIGYKMTVDIPDDCVDLLMPKKELIKPVVANFDNPSPSTEGLLALDKYLNEIGLKSNKKRSKYLEKQYQSIVNRSPDADLKLQELLLACDFTGKNNKIVYTDNLILQKVNGISMASNDDGKNFYSLTAADQYIDNKTKQASVSKEQTKSNEQPVLSSALLAKQQTR